MPKWETVGEVIFRGHNRLEWKVDERYFLNPQVRDYVGSPTFKCADSLWYFGKWPYGWSGPLDYKWIALSVYGTNCEGPVLKVRLGMRKVDGTNIKISCGTTNPYGSFEEPRFFLTKELQKKMAEVSDNGHITVFCEVSIDRDYRQAAGDTIPPLFPSFDKLLLDLKALMSNEKCDITFRVQGKELSAHKLILGARCPVFRCMFKHQMLEETSGVVQIEDCDPDSFRDLLLYLYTGSVESMSRENVFGLFAAAHKYCLDELRNECLEFIRTSLCVDTFCETVELSLRYTEAELLEQATKFFAKHMKEIIVVDKWVRFLHENTAEGNKLFVKALVPEES